MTDKATKRSVSLKSGKTMENFLENHCQKHILSPVLHDQHPETHSLELWLTFNATQLGPSQVMIHLRLLPVYTRYSSIIISFGRYKYLTILVEIG